jgi:glutamate-1-semialdehyde 2,1-aminomutase
MRGVQDGRSFDEYLAADRVTYKRLIAAMLSHGLFPMPDGRWYLSTAHTDEDLTRTLVGFKAALEEVVRQ